MCELLDEYAKEYAKEYAQEERNQAILKLLEMGDSPEKISFVYGISIEEVNAIEKSAQTGN